MEDLNNGNNGLDPGEPVEAAVADGQPGESAGAAPEVESCKPIRRGGGPRTQHGKAISRRNALKHGFLAKEALIETEFYKEDKKGFQRLLKGLIDDWRPVGATEVLQVELMGIHLLQYRRLLRVQQALILQQVTPKACDPDLLIDGELEVLKMEKLLNRPENRLSIPEDDLLKEACERAEKKYKEEFDRGERLEEEHARIGRLKAGLAAPLQLEWLQKYEAHILRQYYRALAELERLQRMRLGDGVPPRLVVEVNNS